MKSIAAFVSLFAFVLLLPSTPARCADDPVWEHVTVVQADGAVLEDVSVRWGLNGFSLTLTDDGGATRGLSPSQVATILDADGNDITQTVADACPAEGITFSLLGAERVVPLGLGWMAGAGVTGGLVNDDADFLIDGAAWAGLRARVCSWSHLHVLYRHQSVVENVTGLLGQVETHANEIHLLIGSRMTHPRRNDNFVFLEIGPSLVRYGRRCENDVVIDGGEWTLAGTLRAGLVYPLGGRFGLEAGGIFMARPSLVEERDTIETMFGLDLGLTMRW